MDFTRPIVIELPYDQAVVATKAALADQGFGTLTEVDLRQTLKDKLDLNTESQVIIGACNPETAHGAMGIDARTPTLLPWPSQVPTPPARHRREPCPVGRRSPQRSPSRTGHA